MARRKIPNAVRRQVAASRDASEDVGPSRSQQMRSARLTARLERDPAGLLCVLDTSTEPVSRAQRRTRVWGFAPGDMVQTRTNRLGWRERTSSTRGQYVTVSTSDVLLVMDVDIKSGSGYRGGHTEVILMHPLHGLIIMIPNQLKHMCPLEDEQEL